MSHLERLLQSKPTQQSPASSFRNPEGPRLLFNDAQLVTPTAIYVSPDDSLALWVRNPTVDVTVQLHFRMLTAEGEVKVTTFSTTVTAAALVTTKRTLPPVEGFLLSATAIANCVSRGQCFVKVLMTTGGPGSQAALSHLIMQGYVSNDDRLGYPQSPTESSLSGRGWLRDIIIGAPAAGQPLSQTIPLGVHWLIRGMRVGFIASVAVGDRFIDTTLTDPTANATTISIATTAIKAAETWNANFAPGLNNAAAAFQQTAGYPADLIAPGNWTIAIGAIGMDAGDQFTGAAVTVEEFVGE